MKQGPQGPQGATGATGAKGDKGNTGDDADATAALALAGSALAVGTAAGAVAAGAVVSIGALSTTVGQLQGQVFGIDTNVSTLNSKTQFQTSSLTTVKTTFASALDCNSLNAYGNSKIHGNLDITNDLEVSGTTLLKQKITTLIIDSFDDINVKQTTNNKNIKLTTNNFGQSNINILASNAGIHTRDAGVDVSPPLINTSQLSDLGTMSLRAGIINIGNASQTSIINLNGIVNTTFNGSMNITGFINQFG